MSEPDTSGRSRLARNAMASYAGHFVFIVFGFVTPRIIDIEVGQLSLGIWDFCWTLVNYLGMSMVGIGSSVNRYVARYRSRGDTRALNRTVSTVVAIQFCIAGFTFLAAMILSHFVPLWFAERLGAEADTAVMVIRFLGTALAVQMAFDVWRGVLSGCHRWDYYNALNAGGYAVASVLMIGALLTGGGLAAMSLMYMFVTLVTELARYRLARNVCPELRLGHDQVNREDALKVFRFGIKTVVLRFPSLISIQTVNVFVVANLGPAALAILARPMALVNHVNVLVGKFSHILTPTAGSLQGQDKTAELREFAIQSSRAGWLLAIPPLAFLFVMGDLVVALWMGPGYADWAVCAVLVAGQLLPVSQGPLLNVLVGLDAHGAVAKASAIVTAVALAAGLSVAALGGWSLIAAAAIVSVCMGLGLGLTVLYYGFRHLEIGLTEYLRSVIREGAVLLFVTIAALFALRQLFDYPPATMVMIGLAATGIVFLVLHLKDTQRVLLAIRA